MSNGIVGQMADRKERPAYVQFERRPRENRAATLQNGRYVADDVDMALITPPYSRDCFEVEVVDWLRNMENDVRNARMPVEWMEQYKEAYERWKRGQELPLNGTAIKGWGVISPAQQANLITIGVRTVEDLGQINDEGLRRIGMGAIELRDKARAWLVALEERGPQTLKMSTLEADNRELKRTVEAQTQQITELRAQLGALQQTLQPAQPAPSGAGMAGAGISASDILPGPDEGAELSLQEQYIAKFGKEPHHRMKEDSIRRALEG